MVLLSCGDEEDNFPCLDLSAATDCEETRILPPAEAFQLLLGTWRASSSALITLAGLGDRDCANDGASARRLTFLADSTYVISVGELSDTSRWTVIGPESIGTDFSRVILGDSSSNSIVDISCPSNDIISTCEGCNPDAGVVTVWVRTVRLNFED